MLKPRLQPISVAVLLAMLAWSRPWASAQKCLTTQQAINKTPKLSVFRSYIAKIPAIQKITNDPKAKVTVIAPDNQAMAQLAKKVNLVNPKTAAPALLSYFLKAQLDQEEDWIKSGFAPWTIQRYAGGPLTASMRMYDIADPKTMRIVGGYTGIPLMDAKGLDVELRFNGTKWDTPVIKTCAGAVWVIDEFFD